MFSGALLRAVLEVSIFARRTGLPSSAARSSAPDNMTLDQLGQLQPDDIFRRLYLQKYGKEAPPEQLSALAELLLPGA